jgi:hypothetical protein
MGVVDRQLFSAHCYRISADHTASHLEFHYEDDMSVNKEEL